MRKLKFLLFLFALLSISVLKANPALDSLFFELDKSVEENKEKVSILNQLAWGYAYLSPSDGLTYANEARRIAKVINDDEGLGLALSNMGVLYDITGQFDNALIYYQEASTVYERTNNLLELATVYNNIGVIYRTLKLNDNAIEYYNKALELEKRLEDKYSISNTHLNLAIAYRGLGKYIKSWNEFERALTIKQQLDDSAGIMTVISHLGVYFLEQNRLDSAEKYLNLDLKYVLKEQNNNGIANAYLNMCALERKKGNYGVSITFGKRALDVSRRSYNFAFYRDALDNLAKAYLGKEDYKNASIYQRNLIELNDSVFSSEKRSLISNIETKFRNELQEGEVANLRIKNSLKEIAIEQEKREKRTLIIFIALIVLVLLILTFFYINNRKKNRILRLKNDIIQASHKEIEELIKESHHRIKNNLQVVSSMLKLHARSVKSKSAKQALTEAHQRLKAIAIIHQKLYQDDSFKSVNIRSFIVQLIEDLKHGMLEDDLKISISADVDELEMRIDTSIPLGLVINELITNSIKYAFNEVDKGDIQVSLKKEGDSLALIVRDNGVGFPEGFSIEENANFGFRVLKSLLRKYKGEIRTYSDQGAVVNITLNKF